MKTYELIDEIVEKTAELIRKNPRYAEGLARKSARTIALAHFGNWSEMEERLEDMYYNEIMKRV